jgi:hypothetical protein
VTPHQSVAVALRLFAVWLALRTLSTVPWFFEPHASDTPGYVWSTFMLVLTVAVIFALWVFPRTIARKLLPPPDTEPQPSATPDLWLAMGCTLLGLWTLTTTIPRLVYDFFALTSMSPVDDSSQLRHWVLYNLVEVAIAVWLLLGAKGLRKLFWWAQNVGIRKDL